MTQPAPARTWKLGELAVYNRLVDQAEVDECLAIQKEMAERGFRMRLGKILIQKFYLDRISLAALLRAQATTRGQRPEAVDCSVDLITFTPTEHDLVVERVRQQQLIQPEHVDECFDIQFALEDYGIDKQLGEICIEKGYLSREIVSDILARHEGVRKALVQEVVREGDSGEGQPDESNLMEPVGEQRVDTLKRYRFGRLVIEKGLASSQDVKKALYAQLRLKELGIIKRVGEILVEFGHLRPPDVRRILQLQKQRLGAIRWGELAQLAEPAPKDRELGTLLVGNGILSQDEVDECRFVQKAMQTLGFTRSLGQVIVEKEFLDREVVEGVEKEQQRRTETATRAREEAGPVQVDAHTFRSKALEDAYKDILAAMAPEAEEERAEPVEGVTFRRRNVSQKMQAIQARPATRPSRVIAGVLAGSLLGVIAIISAAFLATRETSSAPAQGDEGPGRTGPAIATKAPDSQGGPGRNPKPPRQGGTDGAQGAEPGDDEAVAAALAALRPPPPDPGPASVSISAWSSPDEKRIYLLVAGLTRYPTATVHIAFLLAGEDQIDQRRARVEEGRYAVAFGPYCAQPPTSMETAGPPWLPAGEYSVAVHVRPGDEEWRKGATAAGMQVEGRIAQATLAYPSAENLERLATEEREVVRYLASFLGGLRQAASELLQTTTALEAGEIDAAAAGQRIEAVAAVVAESKSRLDRFAQLLVRMPRRVAHAQLLSAHETLFGLTRLALEGAGDPPALSRRIAPQKAELEALLGSLEHQLRTE